MTAMIDLTKGVNYPIFAGDSLDENRSGLTSFKCKQADRSRQNSLSRPHLLAEILYQYAQNPCRNIPLHLSTCLMRYH